jgi:hypothetical protein
MNIFKQEHEVPAAPAEGAKTADGRDFTGDSPRAQGNPQVDYLNKIDRK